VTDDIETLGTKIAEIQSADDIRSQLWRNATYLFSVLRLNAGYAFSDGRWEEGVGYYDEMERVVAAVPLDDRDWFFKEKQYIDERWEAYARKANRNEIMSEIGIGVKMSNRFKHLMSDGESVLLQYSLIDEHELIILTDPWGMALFVDERKEGQSPVRLRRMDEENASVRIEDPWCSGSELTVQLDGEREILFVHAVPEIEIQLRPVEVLGRNRFRLQWEDLEDASGYRVQLDTSEGDFSAPVFEKTGVRDNGIVLNERLEPGVPYRFRVQGINKNGVVSPWSYSEPFSAERSG
jgi:hypothetical protein